MIIYKEVLFVYCNKSIMTTNSIFFFLLIDDINSLKFIIAIDLHSFNDRSCYTKYSQTSNYIKFLYIYLYYLYIILYIPFLIYFAR